MTLHVHLIGESPIRLWGLSSRERIRRLLTDAELVEDLSLVPPSEPVLLLRGDYLFDPRLIQALAHADDTLLRQEVTPNSPVVAAKCPAGLAPTLRENMLAKSAPSALPDSINQLTPDELCPPYQAQLLKSDSAFVLPIDDQSRGRLERMLFGAAYKGITDLVTKWVWPVPAQWGVRACVRLGLSPNHVTTLSWVLAIAAGFLFWQGQMGWGLLLGWFMTYLDTVDGKLARVTVTSSKFGHLFDHILDLVHPPLWYLAWALGLATYQPWLLPASLTPALWLIFGGYLAGRLVEGAFQLWLGRFGIFCWRRIDSFSRLITARRNPCLVLLTLGAVGGRPDLGLEAVALWTGLSSLFLLMRLGIAGLSRRSGPLTSWLAEIRLDPPDRSLAVRWFASGRRS